MRTKDNTCVYHNLYISISFCAFAKVHFLHKKSQSVVPYEGTNICNTLLFNDLLMFDDKDGLIYKMLLNAAGPC